MLGLVFNKRSNTMIGMIIFMFIISSCEININLNSTSIDVCPTSDQNESNSSIMSSSNDSNSSMINSSIIQTPLTYYRVKVNSVQVASYSIYDNAINDFENRKLNLIDGDIISIINSSNNNVELYYRHENSNDVNTKHLIMGESEISIEQAESYLHNVNSAAPYLAMIYQEEGEFEGVRWDIAFAQSIKETNYFRFGGDVSVSQNNFSGLGAVGNGEPGLFFDTPRAGIKAQIQHLKAYASIKPLNGECVDVRFKYVTRGIAPYVEDLGNGIWASDPNNYGKSIYSIIERMKLVN